MSVLNPDGTYYPKQRYKRYNVQLPSLVVSNGKSYAGFIQNVSEEGLAYETHSFSPQPQDFSPHKRIHVVVKMPSGDSINLHCEIKWSSEESPWPLPVNYSRLGMGMHIIDPPDTYRDFVRELR